MKRVIKIPPKPTKEEEVKLSRFFYLPGWQFDKLIEDHCILVSSRIIKWDKQEPVYAGIYGLRAILTESEQLCFGNFFVRFQNLVYQFCNIEQAVGMIELLKKEKTYEEYEDKMWRKKLHKQKQLKNAKLKLLKPATIKKAS